MFAKRARTADGPTPRLVAAADAGAKDRVPSIIAIGMSVEGEIAADGEIHVDGTVTGTVTCATLTVGRDGKVTGRVRAAHVRVHGATEGELIGDRVEVTATGRVGGRVYLRTLEVQTGASYFCETHPIEAAPGHPAPAKGVD